MAKKAWQLPDYVSELTGKQSKLLEEYRKKIFHLFDLGGYDIIHPSLFEYYENLSAIKEDKYQNEIAIFNDPIGNEIMGIRSDITIQAARIDANLHKTDEVSRFCYIDNVIRLNSSEFNRIRNPIQAGVEIFGGDKLKSKFELMNTLIDCMNLFELNNSLIEMGNLKVLMKALTYYENLDANSHKLILKAVQNKNKDLIIQTLKEVGYSSQKINFLIDLISIAGDSHTFDEIKKVFGSNKIKFEALGSIFQELSMVEDFIKTKCSMHNLDVTVYYDFSEVSGYFYKTGFLFSIYHQKLLDRPVFLGGSYDNISEIFGVQQRNAIGFSFDLKTILKLISIASPQPDVIYCSALENDKNLLKLIQLLKEQDKKVVFLYNNNTENYHNQIIKDSLGNWIVSNLQTDTL